MLCLLGSGWHVSNAPSTKYSQPQPLLLLAYLALAKQPIMRSQIAPLFWEHVPVYTQQLKHLSDTLRSLRKVTPLPFGEDEVRTQLFSTGPSDIILLQEALEQRNIRKIQHLYHGPFLADIEHNQKLNLPKRPQLYAWLLTQRSHTHGQVCQIVLEHASYLLAQHTTLQAKQLLQWLKPHLQALPLLDEQYYTHWLHLYSLAQFHSHTAALEVLDHVSQHDQALADRLHIQLKRHVPRDTLEMRKALFGRTNLHHPHEEPHLWGRESELASLQTLLLTPSPIVITILGIGGVGKTHLLRHLSYHMYGHHHFLDGVLFLPLQSATSNQDVALVIAEALEIALPSAQPWQALREALRDKAMLLALDNLEHLPQLGPELALLTTTCPKVRLVVTSRSVLGLGCEQRFPLQGLPFTRDKTPPPSAAPSLFHADTLEALQHLAAMQLFLEQVHKHSPAFAIHTGNAYAVQYLCWSVGGLPLGVKLMAAWLQTTSLEEITTTLHKASPAVTSLSQSSDGATLDLTLDISRDVMSQPLQERLHLTFERSWLLLEEMPQQAYMTLSVLHSPFTAEVAAKVVGVTLPLLRHLVEKSLLKWDQMFSWHPLLHQHALTKLQQHPEVYQQSKQRHSDFFLARIQTLQALPEAAERYHYARDLSRYYHDIAQAWHYQVTQQHLDVLQNHLNALEHFAHISNMAAQVVAWLQHTEHYLTQKLAVLSPEFQGELLTRQARCLSRLENHQAACSTAEQALSHALAPAQRAELYSVLAWSHYQLGGFETAHHYAKRHISLYSISPAGHAQDPKAPLSDRYGTASHITAVRELGLVQSALGEFEAALASAELSNTLAAHDIQQTLMGLWLLILIRSETNQYQVALQKAYVALNISDITQDTWNITQSQLWLAHIYNRMGDPQEATCYLELSQQALSPHNPTHRFEWHVEMGYWELHHAPKTPTDSDLWGAQAEKHYRQAFDIARQQGWMLRFYRVLLCLSELWLLQRPTLAAAMLHFLHQHQDRLVFTDKKQLQQLYKASQHSQGAISLSEAQLLNQGLEMVVPDISLSTSSALG